MARGPACCARCGTKTNANYKMIKNRRKIVQEWMVELFRKKGIDPKVQKYCCLKCYKTLIDKSKKKNILSELDIDYDMLNKKKAVAPDSYFLNLDPTRIFTILGITKDQLISVLNRIDFTSYKSSVPFEDACGFYLSRLRTGLSVRKLLALIPIGSYCTVTRCINQVRALLTESFVKRNLGIGTISRKRFIQEHTTQLSKDLFDVDDSSVIVVLDGTYVYIEKSSNYSFQRATYSMHKGRNLLKFMMIVSTTGFVIDCLGPYLANGANNDAQITKSIMKKEDDCKRFFQNGDVFIVDRGFRDSLDFLKKMGIDPKMPSFLTDKKQHSDIKANESRLVT